MQHCTENSPILFEFTAPLWGPVIPKCPRCYRLPRRYEKEEARCIILCYISRFKVTENISYPDIRGSCKASVHVGGQIPRTILCRFPRSPKFPKRKGGMDGWMDGWEKEQLGLSSACNRRTWPETKSFVCSRWKYCVTIKTNEGPRVAKRLMAKYSRPETRRLKRGNAFSSFMNSSGTLYRHLGSYDVRYLNSTWIDPSSWNVFAVIKRIKTVPAAGLRCETIKRA